MDPYQCPECNKSFKNGEELWYHIDDFHRGTPLAKEKKCPRCNNTDIHFSIIGRSGMLNTTTAEMENFEDYTLHYCDKCKKLFKTKGINL